LEKEAFLRTVGRTMQPDFKLTSATTGTVYWIYLAGETAPGPARRAVLFMDGDMQFDAAVAAYADGRKKKAIEPLLLAGVGYGAGYTKSGNRRMRDYTPTAMAGEAGTGGADGFLGFLTGELWPELARRLPLREDGRGLAGHSLGSLAVLHALLQPQPFFTRGLASAPSIWFDDRSILRLAAAHRERHEQLPARLFLDVGAEDTPSMTGDLQLLEQQLTTRPYRELEWTSRVFPGKDHFNVLPTAFGAGLSWLYPGEAG
jgi:predicted alpha/beta superfamily hydrolase